METIVMVLAALVIWAFFADIIINAVSVAIVAPILAFVGVVKGLFFVVDKVGSAVLAVQNFEPRVAYRIGRLIGKLCN